MAAFRSGDGFETREIGLDLDVHLRSVTGSPLRRSSRIALLPADPRAGTGTASQGPSANACQSGCVQPRTGSTLPGNVREADGCLQPVVGSVLLAICDKRPTGLAMAKSGKSV